MLDLLHQDTWRKMFEEASVAVRAHLTRMTQPLASSIFTADYTDPLLRCTRRGYIAAVKARLYIQPYISPNTPLTCSCRPDIANSLSHALYCKFRILRHDDLVRMLRKLVRRAGGSTPEEEPRFHQTGRRGTDAIFYGINARDILIDVVVADPMLASRIARTLNVPNSAANDAADGKVATWADRVRGIPNAAFSPAAFSTYCAFSNASLSLVSKLDRTFRETHGALPNAARGNRSFKSFAAQALAACLWSGNARCIAAIHPLWFPV